jgi:hypothetical protein
VFRWPATRQTPPRRHSAPACCSAGGHGSGTRLGPAGRERAACRFRHRPRLAAGGTAGEEFHRMAENLEDLHTRAGDLDYQLGDPVLLRWGESSALVRAADEILGIYHLRALSAEGFGRFPGAPHGCGGLELHEQFGRHSPSVFDFDTLPLAHSRTSVELAPPAFPRRTFRLGRRLPGLPLAASTYRASAFRSASACLVFRSI